jgi:hypothetical protein
MYEQLFDEPLRQQFSALSDYLDEDGSPWSVEYDKAFTQAARLSPVQRKILTDERGELGEFYPRYFGIAPERGGNLRHVSVFNERAKLDFQGVEALLSLEKSSTTLSENVEDPTGIFRLPVSGVDAGSVYIHDGHAI